MLKLLGLLFAFTVLNVNADTVAANISNQIKAGLKASLPEVSVDQINSTPLPNIYEVVSGHKVFYVDASGRYAFLGNMVDLTSKQSLTQTKVEQLSQVNFSQLPFNLALRQVIGTGERRLAVFTDPDCPYCQRLEQDTIPKLTNVTIYYFLYPLPMHTNAETDARKIVCSETPDTTYLSWMKDGKALPERSDCKNVSNLATIKQFGSKVVGVEATPTLVFPNGKVLAGMIPPDYLNQLLTDTNPAPKAKSSAAK